MRFTLPGDKRGLLRYILGKLDLEINRKGYVSELNQEIMAIKGGRGKFTPRAEDGSFAEMKGKGQDGSNGGDMGAHRGLDGTEYPSLSVVVPSYNQGPYLEETIQSVLGQHYPKLELIVIDGGSTDNSVKILEKYASQISYWHSRKDRGQADAINQGINRSSGDVVCWLNSDDLYLPGTLLDVGRRFAGHTDTCYLIYGATVELEHGSKTLYCQPVVSEAYDAFKLTYWDFIIQPSTFWTRKLWVETRDIDIRYHYVLDWDWFIRASKIADFEYVPRFYSIYRLHPHHKTHQGGSARREEVVDVVRRYSSDYWVKLYEAMHRSYEALSGHDPSSKAKRARKRYPTPSWPPPEIKSMVEDPEHFWMVVNMLGIHVPG
jgi:glycosyltransferase involved in cell wall biosynthesis